jgi:hypothetical protein
MSADLPPEWSALTAEQRDAIIRPRWEGGASAAEIAKHDFRGATRNAVIGRVTRGKMGSRVTNPRPKAPGRSARMRDPSNLERPLPKVSRLPMATPAFVSTIPPRPRAGSFDPLTQVRPALPGTTPISLMDLPAREGGLCRFAVEGGYCGVETEAMYCDAHAPLVYNSDALAHRRKANGSLVRGK